MQIEKGRPLQNYLETTFAIQRRIADWHFARAGTAEPNGTSAARAATAAKRRESGPGYSR